MTARVCYFCSDRPATAQSPVSRRPCCAKCLERIEKQLRLIEAYRVGPPLSVRVTFDKKDTPKVKTYVQHAPGCRACAYHAGIDTRAGGKD